MSLAVLGIANTGAIAGDDAATVVEAFAKGKTTGSLRTYYFGQSFEGDGLNDADIWVNGGHLKYETGKFHGIGLGAEFQGSFVGAKDDDDNRYAMDMDADGAVLSEAYLQYNLGNTEFKGGRQHIYLPLVLNSGTRMIKESFEGYFLNNTDIPDTIVSIGWVRQYQTRTDKSRYPDNWFVDYEDDGSGEPGGFYDVGDDGLFSAYLKNNSLSNLIVQAHYTDVPDEVVGFYSDAVYTFAEVPLKPFVGAQLYYTSYDDAANDDNSLTGFKAGLNISGVDLFVAYTTAGGSADDARVYRGLGVGCAYQYTEATATGGLLAFEAGTDSYQAGIGYNFEKSFSSRLRFTNFDRPADLTDLDEYGLNLVYNFGGSLTNLSMSADFSVLDFSDNQKDAIDLRTRLIYSF